MPAKSRRGRYSPQVKKKKAKHYHPATAPQAESAAPVSAVAPSEVTTKTRLPGRPGPPTAVRDPYVAAELRRIGILAGIIIAILVVMVVVV